MRNIVRLAVMVLAVVALGSCDRVNNKETPNYAVRIDLGSYAQWATYGVSGVGEYRIFNRVKGIPANFPYNVNTYTGYGGVLLIMGLDASTASYAPIAFHAACPVENNSTISVGIDESNYDAVCPSCGSHYNVLTGSGGPISGTALEKRYGLRTCRVTASNGGYLITSTY